MFSLKIAEFNAARVFVGGIATPDFTNASIRIYRDQALYQIPMRDYIYLTGELASPDRQAMSFGRQMTLADGLYVDEGFSAETGNPSQIYVLRDDGVTRVTAWQLDSSNVTNLLLATEFKLYPNDTILWQSSG